MALPNTYHHGRLGEALLEAAREHVRSGERSIPSLRSVARAVGVSHAAAYRHYRSRRHLLAAVAADALVSLAEALEKAAKTRTPCGVIEALAVAYVRWGLAEPESLRLAFASELWDKEDLPELRAAADRASRPLLEAVAALNSIEAGQRRRLAVAIWSQVHGVAILAGDAQLSQGELRLDGTSPERVLEAVVPAVRALISGWSPHDQTGQ